MPVAGTGTGPEAQPLVCPVVARRSHGPGTPLAISPTSASLKRVWQVAELGSGRSPIRNGVNPFNRDYCCRRDATGLVAGCPQVKRSDRAALIAALVDSYKWVSPTVVPKNEPCSSRCSIECSRVWSRGMMEFECYHALKSQAPSSLYSFSAVKL
jgi:hypothetical protein